ncbi:response regulator receiver protein [Caballeronia terrestris]|uniref:Response regulator receiver protein n=2 Tax=Caballeronia TaxID=1827195 RepID=A0A158KY85_9BURK|nr:MULTISPECIES: response regulator [Caballeronia]SAL66462.1 response regulator receiver protein [Caballeronia humi]SAL85925.1 response regulator receiver protein [Caballeronia terrestris]
MFLRRGNGDTAAHEPDPIPRFAEVFLVEDSFLVRRRMAALLGAIDGVAVVGEAADADTALLEIAASDANLVIVDLRLAKGNGLDILKRLACSDHSLISVVMTNQSSKPTREACLSAGANYFFDKTNDLKLALETIADIARKRGVDAAPRPGAEGQLTLLNAFDALASTYTEGGRFCRNTQTILQ